MGNLNWKLLIRAGLLVGIILLYTSVIGMLQSFSEREIVRQTITLGQLILFLPAAAAGFLAAKRLKLANPLTVLLSGGVIGFIASLPVLALVFIANQINLRPVLVNVTPDLLATLTLNQESQLTGSLLLLVALTVIAALGALISLVPAFIRSVLVIAAVATILVGALSDLMRQILQQVMGRDALRMIFDRNALTPGAALVIFAVVVVLALLWTSRVSTIRQRTEALPPRQRRNLQYSSFAFLMVGLLLLPWMVGNAASDVLVNVGLYILMGLGLNIAVGMAGLLDLGYVTNFAVGAYVMGVLTSTGPLGVEAKAGVEVFNFWLVIPVSLLVAMFTGFIFAVPVLRMRGDYLAIATLGFGEIIRLLAISDWLKPVIGGAQGILFVPKPEIFGIVLNDPQQIYYVILVACLIAIFVSVRLNNSRIGRQWMAVREDEDVAAAMGINTAKAKLLAFTISAATGGVAGAIFASKLGTIFPNSFNLLVSINVLSLIIVGGMGSIPGVVVGALVLIGLPELLREFDEFRLLLYGVLLVVMMLARPEGLWPSAVHRREMHEAEPEDASQTVATPPDDSTAVVATSLVEKEAS